MWQPELEVDKPRDRIWGVWPTIGIGIIILIASQLAQAFVGVVFFIGDFTSNPDIDLFQYIQDLASNGLFISTAVIMSSIVGIGLIVIFIKRCKGITIVEYLGLNPISKRQIIIMAGLCIALLILSQLAALFIGYSDDSEFVTEIYISNAWLPLLATALVGFAPVFEETLFRGFIFVGLRQSSIGNAGTIALTAALWALIHIQYDVFGISSIFVLGIVMGIVRWKTGSLIGPIIIHSLWNLTAVIGIALYQE